jgi:hypothetical protein
MSELQAMMFDKKGRQDLSQARTVSKLIVLEGVIEPNLKDDSLQKHFGAATPKDLIDILFKGKLDSRHRYIMENDDISHR